MSSVCSEFSVILRPLFGRGVSGRGGGSRQEDEGANVDYSRCLLTYSPDASDHSTYKQFKILE